MQHIGNTISSILTREAIKTNSWFTAQRITSLNLLQNYFQKRTYGCECHLTSTNGNRPARLIRKQKSTDPPMHQLVRCRTLRIDFSHPHWHRWALTFNKWIHLLVNTCWRIHLLTENIPHSKHHCRSCRRDFSYCMDCSVWRSICYYNRQKTTVLIPSL